MPLNEQERREDCRHEVLGFLVERSAVAFPPSAIHRRLSRITDFSREEIEAAAAFLAGGGFATAIVDPLGATPSYQATAAGILAHERR